MIYNYKQIKKLNEDGILLKDGTIIKFDECRKNWSIEKKVEFGDTVCVAERNSTAKVPYYIFYTNERIKIVFPKTLFSCSKKKFLNIQMGLNRFGYSSYDCS